MFLPLQHGKVTLYLLLQGSCSLKGVKHTNSVQGGGTSIPAVHMLAGGGRTVDGAVCGQLHELDSLNPWKPVQMEGSSEGYMNNVRSVVVMCDYCEKQYVS